MPPLVSVVIPNYNHGRYLRQRIDSVLGQDFTDFEVILLDDASTDNSRAIIASCLTDPRVRFHPNDRNSGSPFVQWNRGLALARGELVWLAESDDFADRRLLSELVPLLRANPAVGLAYCQSWQVDAAGQPQGTLESYTSDLDSARWMQPFVNGGRDECRRFLSVRNTIPNASAVVFRREVFLRAGGAPENMRLAGDWLTWARMLMISDVAFLPTPLNYYRCHAETVRASTAHRRFVDEEWAVRRALGEAGLTTPPRRAAWARDAMEEFWNRARERGAWHNLRRFAPFWCRAPWPALTTAYRRTRYQLATRATPANLPLL